MHALTYTNRPQNVFDEIHRVLKPGGVLLAVTLNEHSHKKAVQPFDHVNLGYSADRLAAICTDSGLKSGELPGFNRRKAFSKFCNSIPDSK